MAAGTGGGEWDAYLTVEGVGSCSALTLASEGGYAKVVFPTWLWNMFVCAGGLFLG